MTGNVTRLPGAPLAGTEPPDKELIEALERLLEMARSGEVQGVMCAYLTRNMVVGEVWEGMQTYSLIGRTYALCTKTAQFLEDD